MPKSKKTKRQENGDCNDSESEIIHNLDPEADDTLHADATINMTSDDDSPPQQGLIRHDELENLRQQLLRENEALIEKRLAEMEQSMRRQLKRATSKKSSKRFFFHNDQDNDPPGSVSDSERAPQRSKSKRNQQQPQEPSESQQGATTAPTPEREEEEQSLPEDTYGFLTISTVGNKAWWFGLFIVALQYLLFGLFLINISEFGSNNGNPFNVPPDVDPTVRMTQVFAILISVFVQDELRMAVELGVQRAYPGFHMELYSDDEEEDTDADSKESQFQNEPLSFPRNSQHNNNQNTQESLLHKMLHAKWYHSLVLRGGQGLLSLFVSFVLIIQSDNVFDLLLNFTAIMFLSELDEICFALASGGYYGVTIKREAKAVEETKYFYGKASKAARRKGHMLLLIVVTLAMYGGFVIIVKRQSGAMTYFSCQRDGIHVEFGDVVVATLGIYTGVYELGASRIGRRVVYENSMLPSARLGYCEGEMAWTLFHNSDANPCDFLAKSSETESYDVMEVAADPWFSSQEIPLEHFEMACRHVVTEVCNGIATATASSRDDSFCPALTVPRVGDFTSGFSAEIAKDFKVLSRAGVQIYNHPVYWGSRFSGQQQGTTQTVPDKLDLVIFTGRRWVLTDTSHFDNKLKSALTEEDLEDALASSDFHATEFPANAISFISDPVDRSSETCSPVGLGWHHVRYQHQEGDNRNTTSSSRVEFPSADFARPVASFFSCATCSDVSNPCLFEGICHASNGTCTCRNSATGPLCEVPPLRNGRCNAFFNNEAFRFDGGDCCGATCVSPRCGLASLSFAFGANLTRLAAGFPHCRDPAMVPINIVVEDLAAQNQVIARPRSHETDTHAGFNAEIRLECGDITYLSIPFGNSMSYERLETVRVKPGVDCIFTMNPHSSVSSILKVTISQDREESGNSLLSPELYVSKGLQTTEFPVISPCLREELFGDSALPDTNSSKYSALRWLNSAPSLDGFGCSEPLLMERYALAVLNYATGDVLQSNRNWLLPGLHCSNWEGVFCNEEASVMRFNIESLGLTGTIPVGIAIFSDLDIFHFGRNSIQGSLPSELGMLTRLGILGANDNQFTGTIPSEIGQVTTLGRLDLQNNALRGTIPTELGKLENLYYFSIARNGGITGTIPSELGRVTQLDFLLLNSNNLDGAIPSEIGEMTALSSLNLAGNQISASIPTELGFLTGLGYMSLSGNNLVGSIPSELGRLTQLTSLSLSSNKLTGDVPSEIGLLTGLTRLDLHLNGIGRDVPVAVARLCQSGGTSCDFCCAGLEV